MARRRAIRTYDSAQEADLGCDTKSVLSQRALGLKLGLALVIAGLAQKCGLGSVEIWPSKHSALESGSAVTKVNNSRCREAWKVYGVG